MKQLKKTAIIVCAITVAALIFHKVSQKATLQTIPNGFSRNIVHKTLVFKNKYNLKSNHYYIAGLTDTRIYLGSYKYRKNLTSLDSGLKVESQLPIRYPNMRIAWQALFLKVDSPNIYATERISPLVLNFNIQGDFVGKQVIAGKFDRVIPVSHNRSLMRSLDGNLNQRVLRSSSSHQNEISADTFKLTKQLDGSFCVDGMMAYYPDKDTFLYTYYYRNEFYRLDSNLNLIYAAKTIDTNSRAKITVATLKTSQKREDKMFSSPPLMVNKGAAISADKIYIQCALKADNEHQDNFNASDVIDVYSLANGNYAYSFYIPRLNDKPLTSFQVRHNTLVVLAGDFIYTYQIKHPSI